MPRLICGMPAAAILAAASGLQAQTIPPTPEFWEVTGLTAGDTLNLREGPSAGDGVVAELARGTVLRNLGCTQSAQIWCEVELDKGGVHGWAAAQYLQEHAPASATDGSTATVAPLPPAGVLSCSLADQPVPTCPYALRPKQDGSVEVVVTFPDGFQRTLTVGQGQVTSPDPTDEVTATPAGDTTIVEVNGVERIEIPDAAIPDD